jgi:hypothetical protein
MMHSQQKEKKIMNLEILVTIQLKTIVILPTFQNTEGHINFASCFIWG